MDHVIFQAKVYPFSYRNSCQTLFSDDSSPVEAPLCPFLFSLWQHFPWRLPSLLSQCSLGTSPPCFLPLSPAHVREPGPLLLYTSMSPAKGEHRLRFRPSSQRAEGGRAVTLFRDFWAFHLLLFWLRHTVYSYSRYVHRCSDNVEFRYACQQSFSFLLAQ